MQNLPPYKKLSLLFFYGATLKMIIFTPCPSTPVAIQFCTGIKLNSNISAGKYKKIKFTDSSRFSTEQLSRNYVPKIQRSDKMRCYFGQNPKPKGNISPSNFHGQLPNVLFTCLCLFVRVLRVVAVALLQMQDE